MKGDWRICLLMIILASAVLPVLGKDIKKVKKMDDGTTTAKPVDCPSRQATQSQDCVTSTTPTSSTSGNPSSTEGTSTGSTTEVTTGTPTNGTTDDDTEEPPRKDQTPQQHDPNDPIIFPEDFCANMTENDAEFDFIVIGGGSSGSTLSRRLAENPNFKVLLIEAGGDPPIDADIKQHDILLNDSQVFTVMAEASPKYCQAFLGGRCLYRLPKILGGNSIVDSMTYLRGHPQDVDHLEDVGMAGWNYDNMVPYFMKLENYSAPTEHLELHGHNGPISVNVYPPDPLTHQLKKNIIKAINASNIPIDSDLNGPKPIGFAVVPGIIESNGYRENVVKAYLLYLPDNMKVCKHTMIDKFDINPDLSINNVQGIYSGGPKQKPVTFKARKEYILTSGPIGTPQILERSGIGRKEVLENAKVTLKHELEGVGENLQERLLNYGSSFILTVDNTVKANPLSAGLKDLVGFLNLTDYDNPMPDIVIHLGTPKKIYTNDINEQFNLPGKKDMLITMGPSILRQVNAGSVHITSTDPTVSPKVDLNLYKSHKIMEMLAKGVRLMREIMANKHLKKYNPRPFRLTECQDKELGSDEEIICQASLLLSPLRQFAGTARMGPNTDREAVVDGKLKVIGIPGLRVADLSAWRRNPRGESEIPSIALAERAADLIKKEWDSKEMKRKGKNGKLAKGGEKGRQKVGERKQKKGDEKGREDVRGKIKQKKGGEKLHRGSRQKPRLPIYSRRFFKRGRNDRRRVSAVCSLGKH